ncbi:hypothetical protein TA3x_000383 [Tundrisphaera sp. TA3]|uniref:hypothetical protein n=1 Tax=Tundrisphaera sp. TA3 TaxID=3435775 RepID=UPI003EBAA82D
MTGPASLSETAFEFARLCIDWSDACFIEGISHCVFPAKEKGGGFQFEDLSVVQSAVHAYCKTHFLQWAIFGNDREENQHPAYLTIILPHDGDWEARFRSDCLPHALMAVCVQAAKKLGAP